MWLTWSTVSNFVICEKISEVCNHSDLILRKFVIQLDRASPRRRRDRPDLILPGDSRTREQQVLRLVVWVLTI